jgi:hypothetical protein
MDLDFDEIKLLPDERPEDLYQRLLAFIDDNLLKKEGGITHHSDAIDDDEEMTSTIENLIVLTWLRLINPELPQLGLKDLMILESGVRIPLWDVGVGLSDETV